MGTNINWKKKSDFQGSAWVFIKMKTLSELVKNELSMIKKKKEKILVTLFELDKPPSIRRTNIYKTLHCHFNLKKMTMVISRLEINGDFNVSCTARVRDTRVQLCATPLFCKNFFASHQEAPLIEDLCGIETSNRRPTA